MTEMIFDDVRRILLGLLFVVAFGWMGAQVIPGEQPVAQELAATVDVVPPKP